MGAKQSGAARVHVLRGRHRLQGLSNPFATVGPGRRQKRSDAATGKETRHTRKSIGVAVHNIEAVAAMRVDVNEPGQKGRSSCVYDFGVRPFRGIAGRNGGDLSVLKEQPGAVVAF